MQPLQPASCWCCNSKTASCCACCTACVCTSSSPPPPEPWPAAADLRAPAARPQVPLHRQQRRWLLVCTQLLVHWGWCWQAQLLPTACSACRQPSCCCCRPCCRLPALQRHISNQLGVLCSRSSGSSTGLRLPLPLLLQVASCWAGGWALCWLHGSGHASARSNTLAGAAAADRGWLGLEGLRLHAQPGQPAQAAHPAAGGREHGGSGQVAIHSFCKQTREA